MLIKTMEKTMTITKKMINDWTKGCEAKIHHTFINKNGIENVYIKWYKNGKEVGVEEIISKSDWENKNK